MKIGLILLVLAAFLVAMSVSAYAVTADNGADALMLGTKISIQEEVGGLAAEIMPAPAGNSNEELAISINMTMAVSEKHAVHDIIMGSIYFNESHMTAAEPTPGAGGDGLLARFS